MSQKYAWAAGFIDGEGCIYLSRVQFKYPVYRLTLAVSNTHLLSLEALKHTFACGTIHVARSKRKAHHKSIWLWTVSCNNAAIVLRKILPFLITKKEQARIAIASRQYIGKRGGNNNKKNLPNVAKLEDIKNKLSLLKRIA